MAKSNGNGSDWIQDWIEQQREQLRGDGHDGARSEDGAAGHSHASAGPARDFGLRWLEVGQAYLQGWQQFAERETAGAAPLKFGEQLLNAMQSSWAGASAASESAVNTFAELLSRTPALGLAKEHTEAWRELLAAQAESQQLQRELKEVWVKVQADALAMVERRMREQPSSQPAAAANYRELYDLWVDCGEKIFAEVAHSEAYCKLQARVGNAAIRVRARQQALLERMLKQFDQPTRSELNTVHKQMRELRERVASLEAQLAVAVPAEKQVERPP